MAWGMPVTAGDASLPAAWRQLHRRLPCPPSARRGLRNLRAGVRGARATIGVLCLVAAMLLTPAVDGVAKALSSTTGPGTIACLRYLVAGLVGLAVARTLGRPITVPHGDRLGLVLRTGLIMGAMTALIAALSLVSMAEAVGGFLIAPVVSGLLGLCFWGERPTLPRLVGMAVSLTGAVVLARPEAGLSEGALLALLGGGLLGLYLSATRARARRPMRFRRSRSSRCSGLPCSCRSRCSRGCRRSPCGCSRAPPRSGPSRRPATA